MNCPIIEQTADGVAVGPDTEPWGYEVYIYNHADPLNRHELTLENKMRKRKGLPLLGGKQ